MPLKKTNSDLSSWSVIRSLILCSCSPVCSRSLTWMLFCAKCRLRSSRLELHPANHSLRWFLFLRFHARLLQSHSLIPELTVWEWVVLLYCQASSLRLRQRLQSWLTKYDSQSVRQKSKKSFCTSLFAVDVEEQLLLFKFDALLVITSVSQDEASLLILLVPFNFIFPWIAREIFALIMPSCLL